MRLIESLVFSSEPDVTPLFLLALALVVLLCLVRGHSITR